MDLSSKKGKVILGSALCALVLVVTLTVVFFLNKSKETIVYGSLDSYISPSDISLSDSHAFVADYTGRKVYKINLSNQEVEAEYYFSNEEQVNSVLCDGDKVYVLTGSLEGNVHVMDSDLKEIIKTVPVGHTPIKAISTDSKIYVANRFSNTISILDKGNNEVIKELDVAREPMSLTIAANKLYVAGHLVSNPSDEDVVSAEVSVIDLNSDEIETVKLNNGTSSVKGITSSPDGKYVYLTHILARYTYPTSQVDRGWINTNAITIIETENNSVVASVLLDEVELGAPNPWGIATNSDGTKLVVSLAGADELMVIDTNKMFDEIEKVNKGKGLVSKVSSIADFLPFLDGARVRVKLDGKGPRNIAVKDNTVYVCQYFSGNVAIVDISEDLSSFMNVDTRGIKLNGQYVALGEQPEASLVRRGEILWHDAKNTCFQQWQSCSSCHPDARADGFSWDELGDGFGNPKNTKSLLKSHVTPPILTIGSGLAEEGIRSSFRTLMFKELSEEDCVAVDEYLKSLKPVSSPYLNRDGTLTEAAQRGKELFDEIGCTTCHSGPFYTDTKLYDVKTIDHEKEPNNEVPFDTPTLVEIWRTRPWLFNGKSYDMVEALKTHLFDLPNSTNLSDEQLNDLAEFVLSIGMEDEIYSVEQFVFEKDERTIINDLVPGSELLKVSFRKNHDSKANARAIITLINQDGKELKNIKLNLPNMPENSAVTLECDLKVPEDLGEGSYIKVSIVNKNKKSEKLATDYIIKL